MTAAIVIMIMAALSALLVVFTGRRKRCAYNKGFIVIPYRGDFRELEMTVKCYYYEELFESAEYRRRIIVVYKNNGSDCLPLADRFGYIEVVSEDGLIRLLEKSEGKEL